MSASRARLAVPVIVLSLLAGTAGRSFAQDAFERGVERFRARDFAAAATELERAHASDPRDDDASLLLGISYFRLGRSRDAEPLLRQAAGSSDGEVAGSANLFLGLIADERSDSEAARARLDAAARSPNPTLAAAGRSLIESTAPERATFVFLLAGGADSNVPLLPASVMRGGPGQAADAYAVLVVSAAVRPFRRAGLTIEDTASYRQEARLYDFDLFANLASARYDYSGSRACLTAGYGFETMTLGSELYAIGHVAQASARARLAGGFGLDAGYTLADRTYYPNGYAPYTGPTHGGLAGIDFRDRISLSYVILRELTVDPGFVATAQGARLQARTPLGAHADGAVTAWAIARLFDGGRRDTQLHADASLVLDLTAHVGFVVGASVLRNLSTDGDYDYLKVTAHAGIDIGLGVP